MAQPLSWNPQLPAPPDDPRIAADPQYQSDIADLRYNTLTDFHDALQQLGYTDDQGNYVPGLLDIEANRNRQAYDYAQAAAERGVNEAAQRAGTLFSGRRGDFIAEAIHPWVTARSTLEENLPRQLAGWLGKAQGAISKYGLGIQGATARAIGRYVPPGTDGGGGGGGGGGDTTTTTTTTNPNVLPPGPVVDTGDTYTPSPTTPVYDEGKILTMGPVAMAGGGVVDEPTSAVIGDAGPEAVVPLGGGIRDAIARLLIMEQQRRQQALAGGWRDVVLPGGFGPIPQAQPVPQQQAQQLPRGPQVDQQQAPPRAPSVKAVGLKAAARILNEAAKEHEHEAMQGTPMHPYGRMPGPGVMHPAPTIPVQGHPRTPSPAVRRYTHTLGS